MTGCVRTVVIEEGVQLLFGNNHPQLVAAVHHKYDGVAFSEEHSRQAVRMLHNSVTCELR